MASPIQLTPAERGAFGHFFALADPQSTGVVSGNSAVSFFALSGLPSPVLGTIWTLADKDNNGFLTPAHFSIALRLIGHAQSGKVVTDELVQQPGPVPKFKGITLPPHLTGAVTTPSRTSSTLLQPQLSGGAMPGNASEIRPEDRARYTRIFASAGPQGGLLDGEKAKEIFVKSKLPFDKLGAIWNLADTKARGKLDLTDFIIGMHFIQSTMNGTLTTIPATLPAGLYEKAAGGLTSMPPSSPVAAQLTGGSVPGGASSFISRQMTGQGASQFSTPGSPVPSNIRSPSVLQAQRTGTGFVPGAGSGAASGWAVSPAEKAKADQFFEGLDQDHQGILEGQAAVPFFMQSGLNEATLAHVWDLSDITQSGSLTRDEFAVAMHLINLKLTGSDLPQELPPNLIPPSLRGQSLPQAVNPQESDTQKDLFSLMDDDVDLPVSAASAFATPAIAPPASQSRAMPVQNATTGVSAAGKGAFDSAFDDDFLRGGENRPSSQSVTPSVLSPGPSAVGALSPTATGASAAASAAPRNVQPFGDPSADTANQRLAFESTKKSLDDLEQTKSELTHNVASDANSIEDLTTRLETVRMRHQTESEAVKALQERHAAQTAELRKLRGESVHEESELSRLKQEKDEVEQALLKDREDVREMKRLLGERTKEKEALKAEIEKLKKDARQQKGLVAIGKKQLAQAESDVSKAQEELQAVEAGHVDHHAAEDAQEHAAHGEVAVSSPQVAPSHEAALSPTASIRSNNPFDRFTQPSPHLGTAAAGGAVGAVAAGVGAAALAHDGSPEFAPPSAAAAQDDPFGHPPSQDKESVPGTSGATAAFDDNFGSNVPAADPSASVAPPAGANVNQSFDDAFADLDQAPAPTDSTPPDETTRTAPGMFAAADAATHNDEQPSIATSSRPLDVEAEPVATVTDDGPHGTAPTADEVASGADVEPGFTTPEKGKAVEREAAGHGDSDDSSDDDEGPEDVDGNPHFTDSPDEMGGGKDARFDPTEQIPAQTATQAANRFPAIDDESVTSKAPITATTLPASVDNALSFTTPIAATATGTTEAGGADAFHDAPSEITHFEGLDSAQPAGAHERFTTALDDNEYGQRISPAKSRRAPPAVPLRGATGSGSGSATNMGPFTSGASAPAAGAAADTTSTNPMDDFDAAFEDLGPSASNQPGEMGNITATSGFDDTFGDADGFDFVPSFSTDAIFQAPGTQTQTSVDGAGATGGGAFDGFDSTFDNAFESGPQADRTGSAAATRGGQTAQPSSNAGSGFSFDDAFAPIEAISTGQTPPITSSAFPPAAPPRPTATATGGAGEQASALPDDAGPVKQLCAMGFTRPDVIKALEKSNYRTDKALERLLAQA